MNKTPAFLTACTNPVLNRSNFSISVIDNHRGNLPREHTEEQALLKAVETGAFV